jgi:hypothetical protein
MTRQEWLAHADPLGVLASRPWCLGVAPQFEQENGRGLWLFACACCRMVPDVAANEQALAALGDAERCAAGQLAREDLAARWPRNWPVTGESEADQAVTFALFPWLQQDKTLLMAAVRVASIARWRGAVQAGRRPGKRAQRRAVARGRCALRQKQNDLLRCIIPSPEGPFEVAPLRAFRRDKQVRRTAESIYEQNLFAGLPVLGDALEEAGCHDAEVLAHCHGPGPHARGCWVVEHLRAAGATS